MLFVYKMPNFPSQQQPTSSKKIEPNDDNENKTQVNNNNVKEKEVKCRKLGEF